MQDQAVVLWGGGFLAVVAAAGWGVAWRLLRRERWRESSGFAERHEETDRTLTLEVFPGSVVLLDVFGTVVEANGEARVQFGERLGAILRHPAARAALSAALRVEEVSEGEVMPVCSTVFTLDVPVARTVQLVFRLLPGRERRVLGVISDRSEAQALDRMRVDFVAHASHELRTPLASLSGFIEALRSGGEGMDAGLRAQFLGVMAQQSERLKRLIDRLLYLSRVQAHEHQRPRDLVEVSDLVARAVGEMAPQFGGEDCSLRVEAEEALTVRADEDEMVQVLVNLVDNALRYGRDAEKALEVTVFARRAGMGDERWPEGGGVVLGVQDTGRGIEAHHLPRLTERFYRVGGRESGGEGTGLGLSIVRHILDRHEGKIRFLSAPGEGTTCLVWLPPPGM